VKQPGMIHYEEDWLVKLLFMTRGSLVPRACWCAIPSCLLTVGMLYWQDYDYGRSEDFGFHWDTAGSSTLWNATTVVLAILLAFRTRQGLMRFWQGTGLLHQMRGEWFDTVSNCVVFSISAKKKKPKEVHLFRHTLVRLMSRCHGSALEEIAENSIKLEVIDPFGLDEGTISHLESCEKDYKFNKVEVMLHLVQSLITNAHDTGVLQVPPPILSRVYQTISRGFVNHLNACKIVDTRFPFPYVQLITFLMLTHTIITPFMMCALIRSKIMAVLMTFLPIVGMFTINFISVELENPFGTDLNDLPMEHFQTEMNLCLLMLTHDKTDLVSTISPGCVLDFDELMAKVHKDRESGSQRRLSSVILPDGVELESKSAVLEVEGKVAPTPAAAAADAPATPAPPAPSHQELIDKGIDGFENCIKEWMDSVGTQVVQLNGSFNALKTFNEETAALAKEFIPSTPQLKRTEAEGWETAFSLL